MILMSFTRREFAALGTLGLAARFAPPLLSQTPGRQTGYAIIGLGRIVSRAGNVRGDLAEWVREQGVTDPELSPTHAWRHTFKQIADRVGIPEKIHDAITGHAPASEGRKYGAPTVEDMAKALENSPDTRCRNILRVRPTNRS